MAKRTRRELIEGLIKIRNKRGEIVPFKFNKAQEYYWSKKTRRNLIVKARQKGISKLIDADQLIECIEKPTVAVVVSHEKDSTKRLFSAVRAYIDNMIVKPAVSIDSKSEIQFPKRPSSYYIGTAGSKAFGRGDTVNRAHLSEAAFYPDLERVLNGIAEAAEYGQIDIETTPNGRDEIYNMWKKAKAGLSSFTPIFIPWYIDGEYNVDNLTAKEREGLSASVQEMIAIPDDIFIQQYTDEEKRLVARVKQEWDIDLTPGMIKWRRYKIWDKGAIFFQEYPEDDESCFLQTGRSVFTHIVTRPEWRIPLDTIEKWKAKEDQDALKRAMLYGGVDCAEGTLTGDAHCFSVIHPKVPGLEKAAVIFEIHSNEPIDVFCIKVDKICKAFNINLGVEKNGVGNAHCLKFRSLGTRFTEWETTGTSRPVMLTQLEEEYRKEDLIETYREAEGEARDMIYTENNRAEHPKDKHDDRVFSRAIALQMMKRPRPGVSYV